ncbi:MAG: DNA polymerase-3 subunit delta [Alphaproteobacteria bacterium]|jgi:DNA polymerase-3 subunit delta
MKWTVKQLESALKQSKPSWYGLVCVYGEDAGLAKYFAKQVAQSIAPDMNDPFAVDRIRVEDLLENPTVLNDSLSTVSFGFSDKLVYLEGVSKDLPTQAIQKITAAISDALNVLTEGVTLVFSASGFEPKQAFIKQIEKHGNAIGVRCYVDNSQGVRGVVKDFFAKTNKQLSPDALAFLSDNLGNDRAVTVGELEKLAIYVGENDKVTIEDCLASISAAPSVNAFKLCDAIGLRDRQKADEYLHFLKEEGQDSSMVLALVIRHMRRLLQAKEMVGQGENADRAMMSLKPPVFFGKREFAQQMNSYPAKRLSGSLERLCDLQLASRQGAAESNLVIARGILALSF